MKIKELFSGPEKWTQGVMARTKEGNHIDVENPFAESFCLIGALRKCYNWDYAHEYDMVLLKLYTEIGEDKGIAEWNDDKERTFEEVKALVERADV